VYFMALETYLLERPTKILSRYTRATHLTHAHHAEDDRHGSTFATSQGRNALMRLAFMSIRAVVLGCAGVLLGCAPPSVEADLSAPIARDPEISSPACTRYAGDARDVSLQGSARTSEVRCCEADFGFDPQLVANSCGFVAYHGESEELACVHRFEDAQGQTREFRLTAVVDLGFEGAIALHEAGEFGEDHVAGFLPEQPELWMSSTAARHWVLIPGWPATRRLSWERGACDAGDMLGVLTAIAAAPAPIGMVTPLPRIEPQIEIATIEADSLLARYAEPPKQPERTHYPLPRAARALIEHTLHAAATSSLASFTDAFVAGARWGLPDRRQLSARAIMRDGGTTAMTALRHAAARLPAALDLHCPELDRRVIPAVRTGEALMWCVWASADGLDLLVFALRGRIVDGMADAKIEYLGLFPNRPTHALRIPGEPPPPPPRPLPTIICGDPHALDYPEQCPPAQRDPEQEEEE
jgi:hypothetical protein